MIGLALTVVVVILLRRQGVSWWKTVVWVIGAWVVISLVALFLNAP